MKNSFDIIIPIANNDVLSLQRALPFIKKYILCDKIIIIGNKCLRNHYFDDPKVKFLDEDIIIDNMTFEKIRNIIDSIYPKATRRTGWYFQQFIKLGYAKISDKEYYLSWDSDTYPLKYINLYADGKPILDFVNKVNYDSMYFDTIKKIWPDIKIHELDTCSYITEHMFFSKKIVLEMLDSIEKNGYPFYESILRSIDKKKLNLSGFSEFNTYAAYVKWKYTNFYEYREWHNLRNAKFYIGNFVNPQIFQWISRKFDVLSIEDYDSQLFLFRMVNINNLRKLIDFNVLYSIIQPFYNVYYSLRLRIRGLLKK